MPFDQVGYQPETVADEVLRCLIEARKRLETSWFQLRIGGVCFGPSPGCANDMLFRSGENAERREAMKYLQAALPVPSNYCFAVFSFNDDITTTHADVLALFDRAIRKAKGE